MLPNINPISMKRKKKKEQIYNEPSISSGSSASSAIETYLYQPEYEFTRNRIEGLSVTAWMNERVGWLLDFDDVTKFEPCKHEWKADNDLGSYFCIKCLATDFKILKDDMYKNLNTKIWKRKHDRQRWTNEEIEYCIGNYNPELPDQTWLFILREVPENFSWYHVFKVFQKYKLKKLWLGFGCFLDFKIQLTPTIVAYTENFTNHKMGGKYRIPYLYLIYKFTQILNPGEEKYVPIKHSLNWLLKADEWWKTICIKHGFEFIASSRHTIYWDKENYVKKFARCVKRMGLGSQIFTTKLESKTIKTYEHNSGSVV